MTPDRYLYELRRSEERRALAIVDLIVMAIGAIVFLIWKACS